MDPRLAGILACPSCHGELNFVGEFNSSRLVSGTFGCAGCGLSFPVEDTLSMLAPPGVNYDGAFREDMEGIDKQMTEWVAGNFEAALRRKPSPLDCEFISQARAVEGPVIDIASGPGGSWCVEMMRDGFPNGLLVMSDLGAPVMRAWRRQLRGMGWEDRCSLMVFDARRVPFRDESIAAITSVVGLGSVNDEHEAYAEAGRVLRPGGRVFDVAKFFEEAGPTQRARKEIGERATTKSDYEALLAGSGLAITRWELYYSGCGKSDPRDEVPQDGETWESWMIFATKDG